MSAWLCRLDYGAEAAHGEARVSRLRTHVLKGVMGKEDV